MSALAPIVRVHKMGLNPGKPKPFQVRWWYGRERYESFAQEADAWKLRAALVKASQVGEPFDMKTGRPVSWAKREVVTVATWARQYLQAEWDNISPNSRLSSTWVLMIFIERSASDPAAPAWSKAQRIAVCDWLADPAAVLSPVLAKWMRKYSPALTTLGKLELAEVNRRMKLRVSGRGVVAHSTSHRAIKIARRCLDHAVAAEKMEANLWPAAPRGANNRKANQAPRPDDEAMAVADAVAILEAMISHQPSSRLFRCATAITFWSGARPSECVILELSSFDLSESGWGMVRIKEAWIGAGQRYDTAGNSKIGKPKTTTSYRSVPLAQACVAEVRSYLEFAGITSGRLFVGRGGAERPSQSNWGRSLKRACAKVKVEYRKPYAFRHAFASNAAASGVGVAELSVLMGSSIETVSRYYIHVVGGDNSRTKEALERAFGQ